MRIIEVLSRLLAALMLMAVVAMLDQADAHVGHGHAGGMAAHGEGADAAHRPIHVESVELSAYTPGRALAGPCTSNCCAAGMGCCAALMVFPLDVRLPDTILRLRAPPRDDRFGIEPSVPLKPPRAAGASRRSEA